MMRKFVYLAILIIGVIIGLMRLRKQARAAVDDGGGPPVDHWQCPQCGEAVPLNFEKCWNCGSSGEPDTPAKPS